MNCALVAIAVLFCGECPDDAAPVPPTLRPAPPAVYCPNYTPPVRWYCKPCAGCAGRVCLSCQQPYFGSAPYNFRVEMDYPWSQQPAYPFYAHLDEPSMPGEEIPIEAVPPDFSARKPKTQLRR